MAEFVKIKDGWPSIDIGRLRHPITIITSGPTSPPAPATYDTAGTEEKWSPFTTAMAAIDAIRGVEVIRGGQSTAQLFLTVAIWFQDGIQPSMRVRTEMGTEYDIQTIENVLEMNVILILNCIGLGPNT